MKMLTGRSWAYLIGGAAGALVLSAAGGAWSADDMGNMGAPSTAPAQATPPPEPQKAEPPKAEPQQAPAPTESASVTTESSETVTAIDRSARRVTLKDPTGDKTVVSVPKDIKAFDTLKVGDRVDIDYYQSVALSMLPPGTKPSATERVGRMSAGGTEVMGKSLTISAKVVSVDPETNEVTFKGPHGEKQSVKVQDPALQKKLPDLKVGDSVQLTYTEATAADIRPAAAK